MAMAGRNLSQRVLGKWAGPQACCSAALLLWLRRFGRCGAAEQAPLDNGLTSGQPAAWNELFRPEIPLQSEWRG